LAQQRVDLARSIEAVEKTRIERERELEKTAWPKMKLTYPGHREVRRGLDPIPELRKGIQTRMEEDFRLVRLIEEVNQKVLEYRRADDEYRRSQKLLEENQRQEGKRLTDMQGEVAAMRKRQDEQRGRVDLVPPTAPARWKCASANSRRPKASAARQ
jgi:hypothetical protein